jgi:hypothetical protein
MCVFWFGSNSGEAETETVLGNVWLTSSVSWDSSVIEVNGYGLDNCDSISSRDRFFYFTMMS